MSSELKKNNNDVSVLSPFSRKTSNPQIYRGSLLNVKSSSCPMNNDIAFQDNNLTTVNGDTRFGTINDAIFDPIDITHEP